MAIVRTFGVFELDSGNSFNGEYIPHEFETNWYYGTTPAQFTQIQGLRLHGLSRGQASLGVAVRGAQNDMYFGDDTYSTSTVPINLPRNNFDITNEEHSASNRADITGRGLAVQLKIFGTGEFGVSDPEPGHTCQALTIFASPEGAYDN